MLNYGAHLIDRICLFVKDNRVFFALGFLLLGALGAAYAWQSKDALQLTNPHNTVHIVTLTENGFSPQELVIKKGEKVVFNTERGTPYWPASSLHPDHTIYPEFDSKERIVPPENWEFVFDKIGRWKYHDHLAPHFSGVVQVIDEYEKTVSEVNKRCKTLALQEKLQCWDELLEVTLRNDGIDAAFDLFVALYNAEPEVPKECHGWAHTLGEVGYDLYKNGEPLDIRPEATFCSYGYFHGFVSAMVRDTSSLDSVLDFCDTVVRELEDQLKTIENNCIHGVGHSIATMLFEKPDNWAQYEKTAAEGFAVCEDVYTRTEFQEICFQGLFHELHLAIMYNDYGMSMDEFAQKKDLFYYCKKVDDKYKSACYFDFVGISRMIIGDDKKNAMEYVLKEVEDLAARGDLIVRTLSRSWIEFDLAEGDYAEAVAACGVVPDFLYTACIEGLAHGFVEHGEPNNMHEKGFAFCREDFMEQSDKELCMESMVQALEWNYDREHMVQACRTFLHTLTPPTCTAYLQ